MPANPNIPIHVDPEINAYVTWGSDEVSQQTAAKTYGQALDSIQPITRTSGGFSDISVRQSGADRYDWEVFRPGEALPKTHQQALSFCMTAYERVGIIKNIIDCMGDFISQGIRIVHPQPGPQAFFDSWFYHTVKGPERSERFANLLCRTGRAPIKRNMAKLTQSVIDEIYRAAADADFIRSDDEDIYDFKPLPKGKPAKNVIPYSYDFLNPQAITTIGDDLSLFTTRQRYGLAIPAHIIRSLKNPSTQYYAELVGNLPSYVIDPILAGSKVIEFDESRLYVAHFKKDDWQPWALPMTFSVMDDIILLQKMKLCDLAALDGAISHIRIWKLGSLENKLFPTAAAIEKLNNILLHTGNGQSFDIIWGPDLTVEETTTDIHNFLGMAKYEPVLNSIFAGLGIPPSLTAGGGEKGFTNSALSLKTLIERLNYGRDRLREFWEHEIRLVQQAMRFRVPAQVEFKHMVLTDEAAQNQLIINLLDRDVISLDRVREHFGYIPEVEDAAIRRDYKAREKDRIPPKVSPYHEAQPELSLQKIALQAGIVTPSEVGLELGEKKKGEKSALDMKIDQQKKAPQINTDTIPPGTPGQGRPLNSKDTKPRKQRRVLPRSGTTTGTGSQFMDLCLWATDAQKKVAAIIHPVYLKASNKKNMRTLTNSEIENVEHLKFVLLCNLEPYQEVTEQVIAELMRVALPAHPDADNLWKILIADFCRNHGNMPSLDEIHQIQSHVYGMYILQLNSNYDE